MKDFKINIKADARASDAPQQMMAMPVQNYVPQVQQAVAVAPAADAEKPAAPAANDDSKYITVKSPMIGTFYRSPNPETPSFVNVGDAINNGKVICIIEAMKLFNEIESEVSGKIIKVLVDDASPVEYDQPLFLVDPS
jgi:acetyl-CoA carboxylase biotin carboxyl carrier protein